MNVTNKQITSRRRIVEDIAPTPYQILYERLCDDAL